MKVEKILYFPRFYNVFMILSIIDYLTKILKNMFNLLTSNSKITTEIVIFTGVFTIFCILIYLLLNKEKPTIIYDFFFKNEKKLANKVILISIVISILWNVYFWKFTKDDAFITFRYSKNLVEGKGLVFNDDGNPVEGCSNFLWIILSTIPHLLNIDVLIYTKVFSIILSIFTVIMLFKFANIFFEEKIAVIAPLIYALYYPFHLWTVGGLETPFLILLLLCVFYCAHKEISNEVKYPKYSILFGLLYSLSRIDGVAYIVAFEFCLLFYYFFLEKNKQLFKQRLIAIIIFGILYGIYFIWRYTYFGFLLPNTFYVKQGTQLISRSAILYITLFIAFSAPLILFLLYGIYNIVLKEKDKLKIIFLIVPIAVNMGITLLISQFNAGQGFRYILPVVPFMIIIGLYFFKDLHKWMKISTNSEKISKSQIILFVKKYLPPLLLFSLIIIPASAPFINYNLVNSDTNEKHKELAIWFKENVPEDTTIAFIDMGILPYYSELEFIDIWGLMDEEIGQGGLEGDDLADYVIERQPEFIMFKIWGPQFQEYPPFQTNYTLFYALELYEINEDLDIEIFDLTIYKLNSFILSNASLIELFE